MNTQKKPAGLRKKGAVWMLAAFALLFSVGIAGCSDDSSDNSSDNSNGGNNSGGNNGGDQTASNFNGTWTSSDVTETMVISGTSWHTDTSKGTFATTSATAATLTVTHYKDAPSDTTWKDISSAPQGTPKSGTAIYANGAITAVFGSDTVVWTKRS